MQSKTFRLFISSTFNDFRQEREVLQTKVFPPIKEFASKRGYVFQPIDLRWGVNEEAQLDQKTLELCLSEVRACKTHIHPNFLIMVGDRYGWIPLPYAIEKGEFETLLKLTSEDAQELLCEWYKLDLNQLPASYILKERSGDYVVFERWSEVETALRTILQSAVKASSLNEEQKCKYFLSATEAEVEEGIIPYIKPTKFQEEEILSKDKSLEKIDPQYIFGFLRDIDKATQIEDKFIQDDYKEAQDFKKRVATVLEENNRLHLQTTQRNKESLEEDYLKEFEAFIIEKFTVAIDKKIKEKAYILPLEQERLEQQQFKKLKIDTFFGRENELTIIQNYIKEATTQPFVVHGISGIGKSSFISKVIDTLEITSKHKLIYRFIGATAFSSNIRALIESIIVDLAENNILSIPDKFEVDSKKFYKQIKELLESIAEPTVIILDALDQLQEIDFLQWLPIKLPDNLKIILSMLDEKDSEHYYALLKDKLSINNQLKLKPINEDVATKILSALLNKEERCLTSEQCAYLLKQFEESSSSPLYLILAFQEAKTWKSTNENPSLAIGIQNIIKQFIDNLTNKFHHDKSIVHKVLGLISASKDGLSENEIIDLLSKDENILKRLETFNSLGDKTARRFPISIWARLSNELKPFLSERFIDGQNLITFFHTQVRLAVKNYIYEPNDIALHSELADYFVFVMDEDLLSDMKLNNYNLRILEEYPYQLSRINSLETNKLLQNAMFILAKIVNGKYLTLLNNYIYFNDKENLSIEILKMLRSTYYYFEFIKEFKYKFYLQQLSLLDKKYIIELKNLANVDNILINHSGNYTNPLLYNTLSGHEDVIQCGDINGNLLATGDFKGNLIIWNLLDVSKKKYKVFKEQISQIIVSDRNNFIIVRSFFKVKIFDLYSFKEIIFFEYKLLSNIYYSNNDIYFTLDKRIVKINLDKNEEVNVLSFDKNKDVSVKFINNFIFLEYIDLSSRKIEYKIYNLYQNEYVDFNVNNILYRNEKYFFSLSIEDEETILVYDYNFKIIDEIKLPYTYYNLQIDSEVYFISNKFIIYKIHDNRLLFINLENGNSCDEIMHEHIISEVIINEKYIITLGYDGLIKFWDISMLLKYKYDPYIGSSNKIYDIFTFADMQSVKLTPAISSNYCLVEYEVGEDLEKIIFNVETGKHTKNPYNYDSRVTGIDFENKKFDKIDILLDQQFSHIIQILAIEQDTQKVDNPFFSDSTMLFLNNNGAAIDMDSYVVKFRKLNEKIFHEYENNGIRKTAIALTYDGTILIIANENGLISIYNTNTTKLLNALYIGSSISAFAVSKNYLLFFSEGMIKSIQFKI